MPPSSTEKPAGSRKLNAKAKARVEAKPDNPGAVGAAKAETRGSAAGRSATTGTELAAAEAAPRVGQNLRRLRAERGLSLQALSRICGVSRAMLGQIELEQSTPTITVVWKIAQALELPFTALLRDVEHPPKETQRAHHATRLLSEDGSFRSRALFPAHGSSHVEFYELTLEGLCEESADAHAPGTTENLVVADGALEVVVGSRRHELNKGDALSFRADRRHIYRNPKKRRGRYYLLITYERD